LVIILPEQEQSTFSRKKAQFGAALADYLFIWLVTDPGRAAPFRSRFARTAGFLRLPFLFTLRRRAALPARADLFSI